MASITTDSNGRRRIQFIGADGKRRAIRLGAVSMKHAEKFKGRVEQLVTASIMGSTPDDETSRWVVESEEVIQRKLAAVGLIVVKARAAVTLAKFVDDYIADRTDAKPRTIINLKQARKDLVEFFGAARPVKEISEGDADEFTRYLTRRGLGSNTARRICGRAKQFFRAAIRKRLLQANPFADQKCHVTGSTSDRDFVVSREMAQKVLDACPNVEWKLLFALSRYGGLRCPSEHLALTWADIDWERDRIRVRSPKTEHHEGKDHRIIPLFPELRPYLLDALEQAEAGVPHVIARYRDCNANLRTQLNRIIERAGLTPWPKLFHNLRATRQTELAENFPLHVVCAWIGNSAAVAKEHYLQITDDHFTLALVEQSGKGAIVPRSMKAAQNPAQQASEIARKSSREAGAENEKPPVLPGVSVPCELLQSEGIPPRGVESQRSWI